MILTDAQVRDTAPYQDLLAELREIDAENKRLRRSLANVDAAIWGGLQMIDGGRPAQGMGLIRSCLPDDYQPYGMPA